MDLIRAVLRSATSSRINKTIEASIKLDDRAIAKIEAFSKEYRSTGLHIKNMARVIAGKPRINAAKDSGKLAKAISAPYRAERAILTKLMGAVAAAAVRLERLEEKTAAKREAKAAATAEKSPSLRDKLKANKERIRQKDLEKPAQERARPQGLEQ